MWFCDRTVVSRKSMLVPGSPPDIPNLPEFAEPELVMGIAFSSSVTGVESGQRHNQAHREPSRLRKAGLPMTVSALHKQRPFPIPPTALIGREHEVAEVRALFEQSDVRLVTLTGPGGIGKTRIALEVGQQLLGPYRGMVRVILLDSLDDPELVLSHIARELDVPEGDHASTRETLAGALSGESWLLILDNFERLGAAALDIAWLLANVEGLSLLITSRIRLHIQGEIELVTPPLPLPGSDEPAERNAAVTLPPAGARGCAVPCTR